MSRVHTTRVTDRSYFPCNPSSETARSVAIPNTEVEPDLAVGPNPINEDKPMVVVAYQQDRYSLSGGANADYMSISVDGGKTFRKPVPFPTVQCFCTKYERDSDPRVAIDCKGTIYTASIPFDVVKTGLSNVAVGKFDVKTNKYLALTFLDEEDFSAEIPATTDYEFIIVDGKNVYVSWNVYFYPADNFGSEIRFARSKNGIDFDPYSVVVSGTDDALPSQFSMALLNNSCQKFSKIVGVYTLAIGNDTLPLAEQQYKFMYTESSDQGRTWSAPIPLADNVVLGVAVDPDVQEQVIRGGEAIANITTDRERNYIYVVTQENSLLLNDTPSAIFLYFSLDGGRTWNKTGPMNQVPSVQAFTPSISVQENGDIAISYYDFRFYRGTTVDDFLSTDRWLDTYRLNRNTGDFDFVKEYRLTEKSFNLRKAPLLLSGDVTAPPGIFLGDYATQKSYQGRTYNAYSIVPEIYFDNRADVYLGIIKDDKKDCHAPHRAPCNENCDK